MPSLNPTAPSTPDRAPTGSAAGAFSDAPIYSQLADDPDMVELVEMFVSELPNRVEAVLQHWQNRDLRELRRLVHQLKGSSGGYGFSQLGHAAGRLEMELGTMIDCSEQNELEKIKSGVDELVRLCQRVRAK